jgi:hypothetical protein
MTDISANAKLGFGTGRQKWTLNGGQFPDFRVVRVALARYGLHWWRRKSARWVTLRARWVTRKSSLGGAKSSLGDAESSLGDAKSSLGDAESSRGDAKSSLGDAKSSLGDAKSSLGDAESSLGDAESVMGDFQTADAISDAFPFIVVVLKPTKELTMKESPCQVDGSLCWSMGRDGAQLVRA